MTQLQLNMPQIRFYIGTNIVADSSHLYNQTHQFNQTLPLPNISIGNKFQYSFLKVIFTNSTIHRRYSKPPMGSHFAINEFLQLYLGKKDYNLDMLFCCKLYCLLGDKFSCVPKYLIYCSIMIFVIIGTTNTQNYLMLFFLHVSGGFK